MAIVIRQAAAIPAHQLDKLGPVDRPLSSPPSELIGTKYFVGRPSTRMMGVWECSPGRWQRTIMEEEFAHFLEGSARFVPEDGEPIDIRAGDTVWFPPNSRGVWEIAETVRKVYVIHYRRSVLGALRSRLRAMWTRIAFRFDVRAEALPEAGALARETPPGPDARRAA